MKRPHVFTGRELWSFGRTILRFGLTSTLLGAASTWLALLIAHRTGSDPAGQDLLIDCGYGLSRGILCVAALKLLFDVLLFRHLAERRTTSLKRSALLQIGPLSNITLARVYQHLAHDPEHLLRQAQRAAS